MRSLVITTLLVVCACATPAAAQTYPSKPIRLLVGFPPGGGADIVARILMPELAESLQQQIVIDNRAGAGSAIASEIAAKAVADGYTLLLVSSAHAINAGLPRKLSYDALTDFAGVALVAAAPLVLVIYPGLPVKSVTELIELARAKPGQLNFGSSGSGGTSHLAGELLKSMAKINLTHVPYKGAPQALVDVISGQVQLLFPSLPTTLPQIKAGRVKALAVTSAKRATTLPEIPTVAESGVPGYEATNWYGMLAPAGTPQSIVQKLNGAVLRALRTADVNDALVRQGAEPLPSTPADFERYLKSEIAKWTTVIRQAGVRAD